MKIPLPAPWDVFAAGTNESKKEIRSIDEPFEPSCEQEEKPYTLLRFYLFQKKMTQPTEIGLESVSCWSNEKLADIKINGVRVEKTSGFIKWIEPVAVGKDRK